MWCTLILHCVLCLCELSRVWNKGMKNEQLQCGPCWVHLYFNAKALSLLEIEGVDAIRKTHNFFFLYKVSFLLSLLTSLLKALTCVMWPLAKFSLNIIRDCCCAKVSKDYWRHLLKLYFLLFFDAQDIKKVPTALLPILHDALLNVCSMWKCLCR